MNKSLALAIGMDAGNKSMRANGRTEWSLEDAEAANAALLYALALIE